MPSGLTLVFCVLRAVATLMLVGVPGFIAGYSGLADRGFLQKLSRYQVVFLMPSLALSTFGSRFTAEGFHRVYPLAIWSCLQLIAGSCLSPLLLRTRHASDWSHPDSRAFPTLLRLAILYQNIGVFNFPLVMTLCHTEGIFERQPDQCYGDAVLMIFGYHIPWDMTLWTYGYTAMLALANNGNAITSSDSTKFRRVSSAAKLVRVARNMAGHALNPMVAAMFIGIAVGLTPTIREAVFAPATVLSPLGAALRQIGSTAPVMGLQILGGTLGCAVRQLREQGAQRPPGLRTWAIAALTGKLLVLPLLGFVLFQFLSWIQLPQPGTAWPLTAVHRVAAALWPQDRLLRAVVVMQWSAPTCLNLAVLCHRAGLKDAVVQATAILYILMYGVTALTTTFWVTLGLKMF